MRKVLESDIALLFGSGKRVAITVLLRHNSSNVGNFSNFTV